MGWECGITLACKQYEKAVVLLYQVFSPLSEKLSVYEDLPGFCFPSVMNIDIEDITDATIDCDTYIFCAIYPQHDEATMIFERIKGVLERANFSYHITIFNENVEFYHCPDCWNKTLTESDFSFCPYCMWEFD